MFFLKMRLDMGKVYTLAASVEQTILRLVENGGLRFVAYYECARSKFACEINNNWELRGITVNENELSFIASNGNQSPVKFSVRGEFAKSAINWFEEASKKLIVNGKIDPKTKIPDSIVFTAGVTELVAPRKVAAA